ncbi:hypothetical protein HDU67_001014 [Dinochytrium kinnereticum]|nr:hypothetical protein HDU67_001014 [Dinochytrium kinnereticum]
MDDQRPMDDDEDPAGNGGVGGTGAEVTTAAAAAGSSADRQGDAGGVALTACFDVAVTSSTTAADPHPFVVLVIVVEMAAESDEDAGALGPDLDTEIGMSGTGERTGPGEVR